MFTSSINIENHCYFLDSLLEKKIRFWATKTFSKSSEICWSCEGPFDSKVNLSSLISDPSLISSITVSMTGDNYCNLMIDGSWLYTGVWNTYDSVGAHQCFEYTRTITNRKFSTGSYLFFRATDNGELTVSLAYTIRITYLTK